ncbi:hypothetical protein R3P38DRAFT_2838018 [Favolaschia claudopus]|uniref:Uncharacterized protein n=1 Tax=Favolaschia claudopus TaxID=2862362 RepID=A0AAV9ZMN2_9AGAR
MPESDIAKALKHEIEKALRDEAKISQDWPEGHLEILPRSFTVGTNVKSYTTLTVDRGDYLESQEPLPNLRYYENKWDRVRVPENADWAYLAQHQLKAGPVHVAVRGKTLALAAGFHVVVCHLGLEATIIPMRVVDYRSLVAPWNCIDGPNEDCDKAALMRSFVLPERFRDRARHLEDPIVNVFAAVVTANTAFVICDSSRLIRLCVLSSSALVTQDDLLPGSDMWKSRLWKAFPGGPDWVSELPEALACLDHWRDNVLKSGKRKTKCIVDVLTEAKGPGGGIGKHLANDFLYEVAIHPDTPSFVLCTDDASFSRLRSHLPIFMARWESPQYLKACAGRTNSLNPFAFNTTSDRNFFSSYVPVYRRTSVRVRRDLYNLYLANGLFDPDHIIGTLYTKPVTLLTNEWKDVPVRFFPASNTNRYHIINAQVPNGWKTRVEEPMLSDVTNAGFATTLGRASFREQVNNKTDLEQAKLLVHRGRPRKEKTGLPGRPRKTDTKARIARKEAQARVIHPIAFVEQENDELLGSEIPEDGPRRSKRIRLT